MAGSCVVVSRQTNALVYFTVVTLEIVLASELLSKRIRKPVSKILTDTLVFGTAPCAGNVLAALLASFVRRARRSQIRFRLALVFQIFHVRLVHTLSRHLYSRTSRCYRLLGVRRTPQTEIYVLPCKALVLRGNRRAALGSI